MGLVGIDWSAASLSIARAAVGLFALWLGRAVAASTFSSPPLKLCDATGGVGSCAIAVAAAAARNAFSCSFWLERRSRVGAGDRSSAHGVVDT